MAIQNDNTLVTKGDLKALYSEKIAPYLGANMMMRSNTSDFYSTGEKVVGVWTDGKPLYQKSFSLQTPSTEKTNETIGSVAGLNIDKLIDLRGVEDGSQTSRIGFFSINSLASLKVTLNSADNTYYPADARSLWIRPSDNAIRMSVSNPSDCNLPVYVTIQYTKTTDTASSALSAGCYDINFPNTWPENVEIYFGNGIYGYKFSGTVSSAGAIKSASPLSSTTNKFVNGNIRVTNNNDGSSTLGCGYWGPNNFVSGIYLDDSGYVNAYTSSSYYNKKFVLWVTYEK